MLDRGALAEAGAHLTATWRQRAARLGLELLGERDERSGERSTL
jgi:hypothetical protein